MKDYLENNQPVFYHLIENAFKQHKVPHAYLLIGENTEIPLTYLTMSIICESTIACEECDDCRKVKEDKYGDIIRFNGLKETIKKPNISYIQESFKKSSLEGKAKIYILENIENATKEAMNALLKMLEEPLDETYAIFTAKNSSRVLPTILSRCQMIEIKKDSKEVLKQQIVGKGIELAYANILGELSVTVDQAISLYDERFEYMVLQAVNTIEDIFKKPDNLLINAQTNLLKHYKTKDDIRLFLDLLVLALKDLFHVKQNQEILFVKNEILFSSIDAEINDIIKKIEIVLETNYKLESNANIALLMDSMLYRL